MLSKTRLPPEVYHAEKSNMLAILSVEPLDFEAMTKLIDILGIELPGSMHETVDLGYMRQDLEDSIDILPDERPHPLRPESTQTVWKAVLTEEDEAKALQLRTERDKKDNLAKRRGESFIQETVIHHESLGKYSFSLDLAYGTFSRTRKATPEHPTGIVSLEYFPGRKLVVRSRSFHDYVFELTVETIKDEHGRDVTDTYKLVGRSVRGPHAAGRISENDQVAYLAVIDHGIFELSERTQNLASYALKIADDLRRRRYGETGETMLYASDGEIRADVVEQVLEEARKACLSGIPKNTTKAAREAAKTAEFAPLYNQHTKQLGEWMRLALDGKTQKHANDRKKIEEMLGYVRHVIYDAAKTFASS